MVDGDPAVRDSLATLIGLGDHDVVTYDCGQALLRDMPSSADAYVISASELPDMTGLELFAELQRQRPGIHFALLLSRNDHVAMVTARRLGIDAVFQKPLVHRKLRHFLQTA